MTDQETDSRDHHLLLGKWKNRNSEKLTGAENGSSEEELSQALKQWLYQVFIFVQHIFIFFDDIRKLRILFRDDLSETGIFRNILIILFGHLFIGSF